MNNVSLDIEAATQQRADKSAIVHAPSGDVVSYRLLAERVEALTGALRSFGIEKGDRVAIRRSSSLGNGEPLGSPIAIGASGAARSLPG